MCATRQQQLTPTVAHRCHPPRPAIAAWQGCPPLCKVLNLPRLPCLAATADNITLKPEDWQPYQLPIKIAAVNRTVLVHGGEYPGRGRGRRRGRRRPASSPQPHGCCCVCAQSPTRPLVAASCVPAAAAAAADGTSKTMVDWGYALGLLEVQSNASLAFRDFISQRGCPPCPRLRGCCCWRAGDASGCLHVLLCLMLLWGAPTPVLPPRCMPSCMCLPASCRCLACADPGNRTQGIETLPQEIKGSVLWPTVGGQPDHKVRACAALWPCCSRR